MLNGSREEKPFLRDLLPFLLSLFSFFHVYIIPLVYTVEVCECVWVYMEEKEKRSRRLFLSFEGLRSNEMATRDILPVTYESLRTSSLSICLVLLHFT